MPKINCVECDKPTYYSPSHAPNRSFCSRRCYSRVRDKEIAERGIRTRLTGKESADFKENRIKSLREKNTGVNHPGWKGEKASYRALHYWLRRKLGKPIVCSGCGKADSRPRFIQWANIDGKYRRDISDYRAMCVSCHKLFDLKRARLSSPARGSL